MVSCILVGAYHFSRFKKTRLTCKGFLRPGHHLLHDSTRSRLSLLSG